MNVEGKMAVLYNDLDVQLPSIGVDPVNLAWLTFQPQSHIFVEASITDDGKRDLIQMATRLARYIIYFDLGQVYQSQELLNANNIFQKANANFIPKRQSKINWWDIKI